MRLKVQHIEKIIEKVCNDTGTPVDYLVGRTRKGMYAEIRECLWFALREYELPYKLIGIVFDNRDHSTILSGVKRVRNLIDSKDSVMNIYQKVVTDSVRSYVDETVKK